MKKKPTKTGSTSANLTALLLPLDAGGFTRILETIAGESPEEFTGKLPGRRIESAHRLAWCEVAEATEGMQPAAANHAKLAEVTAQRKLTAILDGLIPAIAQRNQSAAAAAEQVGFLSYLKDDAEDIEAEAATLKARDARINPQGEMPNLGHMENEIGWLEDYLERGPWKNTSLDFRDAEFETGLRNMSKAGRYTGEPTKEAAEQRIADLTVQVEEANSMIHNMLDLHELHRLNELESKLAPIRAEITAAADKAATLQEVADVATTDLEVKIEAAAIIARAIIQACQIQGGSTTAAA